MILVFHQCGTVSGNCLVYKFPYDAAEIRRHQKTLEPRKFLPIKLLIDKAQETAEILNC